MKPMIGHPATSLSGYIRVPSDKSISHRALILGACASGETVIEDLLESHDVLRTAACLKAMGVHVARAGTIWRVSGRGLGGLKQPRNILYLGNSGTSARLLMGLVAAHPFGSLLCGDQSLSARPMRRVTEPLATMGAEIFPVKHATMPLFLKGSVQLLPIRFQSTVASAQVKSAILLAALNTSGETVVTETLETRDHTERLLKLFGASITVDRTSGNGVTIHLNGHMELKGQAIRVPADISSAAFPIVAAILCKDSRIRLRDVGMNSLRTGLLSVLNEMGANITREEQADKCGEPVADLVVSSSELRGIDVSAERVPSMVDEFPILAIAAACARGRTRMYGLQELRYKESDRLRAIVEGLRNCGTTVDSGDDWIDIVGNGESPRGSALVATKSDHRIAMAFLVLGLASRSPVRIDDGSTIETSFPSFAASIGQIGGRIEEMVR